jgi:hypothetical protein
MSTEVLLMKSRCVLAVAVLVVGLSVQGVSASSLFGEKVRDAQARRAELAADRAGFVGKAADKWRSQLPDGGQELERLLMAASDEQVLRAAEAATLSELRKIALERIWGEVLGGGTTDLVFFPLTPCRLFDTRLAGGILAPGVSRTLGVNGTPGTPGDLSGQGGAPSNCGVPEDPAAVAVTLTAVSPTGPGNIRAWAANDPAVPLASAINFDPALAAIANTTVIPVCQGCGTGVEIQLRAFAASVHAVGDVVGYFLNPGLPRIYTQEFETGNVLPTVARVDVTLTTVNFTPYRTGAVLVRANGACETVGGPQDDLILVGVNAATDPPVPPTRHGVIFIAAALPDVPMAQGFSVQDRVDVVAGSPTSVTLEAGRLQVPGPGITGKCYGNVFVEETLP